MNDKPTTLPRSIVEAAPTSKKIAAGLEALTKDIASLRKDMEDCAGAGAAALARGFVAMRRLKDKIEEFEKTFNGLFEDYKNDKLPAAFEAEGIRSLPLNEGFRVGVSTTIRASIREGMKVEAYDWLNKNKLGNLITETVNASTLSAAVRHELEENNREFPDKFFNVMNVPNTSVTAIPAKK